MLKHRFAPRRLCGILAAALAPSLAAQAAQGGDSQLGSVVVSASRSATRLEDMALNTTVISREDIQNSPAQTLDQVLAYLPGFNLPDAPAFARDPTGQSISMRGLGNARTLVLIDGTPLNDAFYGTVQWNRVPLSSIERIEVIRGGTSSQWGNLAMGGVVNIVTRAPQRNGGEAQAVYGSFSTVDLSAAKDFVAGDSVKLRLTADNFMTPGYQTVPTIYPTTPANRKLGQGDAYARNSNVGVQAYFAPAADLSGYVRAGHHVMKDLSSNYAFAVNTTTSSDVAGGLTKRLDKDGQVQANAYYQDTQFDKINGSTTTTGKIFPYASATYDDPYHSMGGSLLWLESFRGLLSQLTAGVDYRRIWGSNTTTNFGKGTQTFSGLLVEGKIKPASLPLELTVGARYDYWVSADSEVYSVKPGSAPAAMAVPDQNRGYFDPSVALRLDASDAVTLRAAAYRSFRAPGLNNMYRSYGRVGNWAFSNPTLKPETMIGRELGVDYRWRQGIAKLTYFDDSIYDAVTTYTLVSGRDTALAQQLCGAAATYNPITGVGAGSAGICTGGKNTISYYTNNQNLRSQGIEAELKYDINPQWAIDAGYALTYARLTWTRTSDPVGLQVGGVPKNTGSVGVTWKPDDKLTVQLQARLVGHSWMDTPHANPLPGYATANAKLSFRVDKNLEAFGSVTNLFDREYIAASAGSSYSSGELGMPRAVFVGARMTF